MQIRKAILGAAALLITVSLATAQSGYDLFQQALVKERASSNPAEAIQIYERIAKDFSSNRPLVAKTLVQLGGAYEKRQDKQKARAAYDRVVRDFSTEADAVAEARSRLAAMDGVAPNAGPAIHVAATGNDADSGAFISSDGRFMVRPHWETGDLAVRDMVLGGPANRMKAKGGDWDSGEDKDGEVENAILSPDGRSIVYTWMTPKDSDFQLRIMPNKVGEKSRLLVDSPEYTFFEPAGWSTDGKWILASIEKKDETWFLAWVSKDDPNNIKPIKSLNWRLRRDRPSLSPDGRYIAYSALAADPGKVTNRYATSPEVADQHIYILAADGSGREKELVKGANINENPVWMPDSSRILFVSNRSGSGFGLWSVGVKDGEMTESPAPVRTSITGRVRLVGMTAKGSLYYMPPRTEGAGTDVFFARIDPSTGRVADPLIRPLDNFSGWNRSPSWSPDGRYIAFMRRRPGENILNSQDAFALVVYDSEKGTEKEYPGMTYLDGVTAPIWFHDGKSLLVRRNYDGGQLFQVNLDTAEFRSVEANVHSLFPAGWRKAVLSPDNRTLYFSVAAPLEKGVAGQKWSIVRFDMNTAEQKEVWSSEKALRVSNLDFKLSPDGLELAIILQRVEWKSPHLIRVAIDGSNTQELAQSVSSGMMAWQKDGIYFYTASTDGVSLMRISDKGNKAEAIGITINNSFGHSIDISGDGSRILFSQNTGGDQDLYVIDNLASLRKSTARN